MEVCQYEYVVLHHPVEGSFLLVDCRWTAHLQPTSQHTKNILTIPSSLHPKHTASKNSNSLSSTKQQSTEYV
jgi:hypothetical protein